MSFSVKTEIYKFIFHLFIIEGLKHVWSDSQCLKRGTNSKNDGPYYTVVTLYGILRTYKFIKKMIESFFNIC